MPSSLRGGGILIGLMGSRLALAALSALILYFAFHAFAGEQGLGAWSDLQAEIAELEQEKARLEVERDRLMADIVRLDPQRPDESFIEGLARSDLGYVRSNEIAVVLSVPYGVESAQSSQAQ
jgi:cell division protein FtsB